MQKYKYITKCVFAIIIFYIFSGECGVNDQCGNKEAGCQNDHDCKNGLVCGVEDNICQTNCSLDLCKLQEGTCMANDECKDNYICGINNRCRGNYTFSIAIGLSLPIVFLRKMHHRKSMPCWWGRMYYFKRLYFGYNLYHRWNLQRYLRLFVLFGSELKLLFLIRDMQWYFSMR